MNVAIGGFHDRHKIILVVIALGVWVNVFTSSGRQAAAQHTIATSASLLTTLAGLQTAFATTVKSADTETLRFT